MKTSFTPSAPPSPDMQYPCFLQGRNTGRIVLALDKTTGIVLANNSGYFRTLHVDKNQDAYDYTKDWKPVSGTITIELP